MAKRKAPMSHDMRASVNDGTKPSWAGAYAIHVNNLVLLTLLVMNVFKVLVAQSPYA